MSALLTTIAAVGSFGAGLAAFITASQAKKAMDLQGFLYLHEYLSRDVYSKARRCIREDLGRRDESGRLLKPVEAWSDEDKEQANRVCASYDQAGLLIETRIVGKHSRRAFLRSSWGESIRHQHHALTEYLDEERAPGLTGRSFFRHFDALCSEIKERPS